MWRVSCKGQTGGGAVEHNLRMETSNWCVRVWIFYFRSAVLTGTATLGSAAPNPQLASSETRFFFNCVIAELHQLDRPDTNDSWATGAETRAEVKPWCLRVFTSSASFFHQISATFPWSIVATVWRVSLERVCWLLKRCESAPLYLWCHFTFVQSTQGTGNHNLHPSLKNLHQHTHTLVAQQNNKERYDQALRCPDSAAVRMQNSWCWEY